MNIDIVEIYILMHADYQHFSVYSAVAFTPENHTCVRTRVPSYFVLSYIQSLFLSGDTKPITQVVIA